MKGGTAMSTLNCNIVIRREAEEILDFTIQQGESLLLYGAEDFGVILSWINLADLSLEVIPSFRDSLHECLDWFGTNRQRVEVALTILRDARQKLHSRIHASLLRPSKEYRMLIERLVSDGRAASGSPYLSDSSLRSFK
jgi:hypothetical protein